MTASLAPGARVVVSRTDGLGDVALTLPLCALLRERLGATVVFLCRPYARAVAGASAQVDEVALWDETCERDPATGRARLASLGADAIVHAFPRRSVAVAARDAGIPRRLGTSHRLFHWTTCNRLAHFSRKRSDLHEAQLNVRLARSLLGGEVPSLDALRPLARLAPRLAPPPDLLPLLAADRFTLVVHPKSHGSAREWPLGHWSQLVASLDPARVRVLVTGSVAEGAALRAWLATLPPHAHDLTGRLTLEELLAVLAQADGLVAASTGPLHLAAQLGSQALGLFSPTRPVHPGRWAPLGPRAEVLLPPAQCAGCARGGGPCTCLPAIDVERVRARVEAWMAASASAGGAAGEGV